MANEVSYANQGDLVLAAILNQAIYEMIADKVDLRNTVFFADDPAGSGSATVKIPQVTFDEIMTGPSEAADVSNSALGSSSATVTVARQAVRYDTTDLFQIVSTGKVDIPRLAAGIAMAAVRRASQLIGLAIDGFSSTAGSTGTVFSVDDFFDAQFTLEIADVPGGDMYWIARQKQFTEFQSSLRGEGGAISYQASTAELLAMKAQGYKGDFNGVSLWTSSQVANDGTDHKGAMFAKGAVAGAEATPQLISSRVPVSPFLNVAVPDSAIWVEMERNAAGGLTKVVGNYYCGYEINEDARGVTTLSAV